MTRPVVAFIWAQFGAYHVDRLEAVAAALKGEATIIGIEVATTSDTYDWAASGEAHGYRKLTLFPDGNAERISEWRILMALRKVIRQERVDCLFVSGYERPSHFAASALLRLTGRRPIVMLDSKFDDKPRRAMIEAFKSLLMKPYSGGFAAGERAAAYLRFLGMRRPISIGYDSVSLTRLRAQAAPAGPVGFETRAFVMVARLVEKKNHCFALEAFARYLELGGRRRLRFCGGGPLDRALRDQVAALGIADMVDFLGSQPQEVVARELASAFCLLVPSIEEQWGLVVNEALAFDTPILCSENVGARDYLVRPFVNGFTLPLIADDWASVMHRLDRDRDLWQACAAGSARLAPLGDVSAFVEGVRAHRFR